MRSFAQQTNVAPMPDILAMVNYRLHILILLHFRFMTSSNTSRIAVQQIDPHELKAWIKAQALDLVLLIVSLPNQMLKSKCHVLDYLERGYHADMTYLEENLEKRADPTLLVPGTKVLFAYV